MSITNFLKKYALLSIAALLCMIAPAKADSGTVVYSTSSCQYFVVADPYGGYSIFQQFGSLLPTSGSTVTALYGGSVSYLGIYQFNTIYGQQQYFIRNAYLGFSSLQSQYQSYCNITLTQGSSSSGASAATISANAKRADCIMNWAEKNLPTYFKWSSNSYYYQTIYYTRSYPAGYNQLFFDVANDILLVSGPLTGGKSLNLGKMDSLKAYSGC